MNRKEEKKNYSTIQNEIIESKVLSGSDKLFYVALKSFYKGKKNNTYPSMRALAKRAGMSKRTAYQCRKKLRQVGLIWWERGGGRKHNCIYRFVFEHGSKAEQERVKITLKKNKIGKNEDSLNREKKHHLNREKWGHKIGKNEDRKNKNIKKQIQQHQGQDKIGVGDFICRKIQNLGYDPNKVLTNIQKTGVNNPYKPFDIAPIQVVIDQVAWWPERNKKGMDNEAACFIKACKENWEEPSINTGGYFDVERHRKDVLKRRDRRVKPDPPKEEKKEKEAPSWIEELQRKQGEKNEGQSNSGRI